jgi:ABC-type branched-subunit amino acid transport system ATPase component
LLLDELTSGLHPHMIDQVLDYVKRLATDHNRTIVMIEHNKYAVRRISDRVYQMEAGRIVAEGSVSDVLGSDKDYYLLKIKNEFKSVV